MFAVRGIAPTNYFHIKIIYILKATIVKNYGDEYFLSFKRQEKILPFKKLLTSQHKEEDQGNERA